MLALNTDIFNDNGAPEEVERTLKLISEAGFSHVHWCHEWSGEYIYSSYEMEQIKEWLTKYHLKTKALHSPCGSSHPMATYEKFGRRNFASPCEYNRKAGVDQIKNRVDLAHMIGATEIVFHLYVPFETQKKDPVAIETFYTQFEKSLDELQPYCLEKGVRICLENLFDITPQCLLESFDRLLSKYPKEFLGICLDTGHANMVWHEQFLDIFKHYQDRIYAVHIHDNLGVHDAHAVCGVGNVDWKAFIEFLAKSPYELPLVLELSDRHSQYKGDEKAVLQEAFEIGQQLTAYFEKCRNL